MRTSASWTIDHHHKASQAKLNVELLEDRTVPAVIDWIGDVAGNNNWGANLAGNTNWAGDVLPGNGDVVRFASANAVGHFFNHNDLVGLNLNGIVINRVASANDDFTLTGNAITLGSVGVDANIGWGQTAIRNDLKLSAKQVFRNTGAGDLRFRGTINLNSKTLIVLANNAGNDFLPDILFLPQSVITGSGSVVKAGNGFVSIDGNNNYTGETRIAEGVLIATSNNALGAIGAGNDTIVNSGSLFVGDGGDTIAEAITLSTNTGISNNAGSNTLTGNITLTGDASISRYFGTHLILTGTISTNYKLLIVTYDAADIIEIREHVVGTGTIQKENNGQLLFTGGNTNTIQNMVVRGGVTTFSRSAFIDVVAHNGSLLVTGNSIVRSTVAGQIADTADVRIEENARLELVNVSETIDDFTVSGNAVLTTGTGRLVTDKTVFYGLSTDDTFYVNGTNASLSVLRNSVSVGNIAIQTSLGIDAREGNDRIDARGYNPGSRSPMFLTYSGDDTIIGTVGNDVILAQFSNGNGLFDGREGSDLIAGGSGNEVIYGGEGNDTVNSGGGNDTLYGNGGDDSLVGLAGNDYLQGDDGNDRLYGSANHDSLNGGIGNDTLFGGTEIDAYLSSINGNLILSSTFADFAGTNNDDILDSFESAHLTGSDNPDFVRADGFVGEARILANGGNDTVVGTFQRDFIDGGDGDDSLMGWPGDDTIFAGDGNDLLDGYLGDDKLYGQNGNDTVIGSDGNDRVLLDDSYMGEFGHDVADLGTGNDYVVGGDGNDTIIGGVGVDTVLGGDGNDLIQGDDDMDILLGENDDDTLLGNVGDDTLDGGLGNDIASGGTGINVLLNIP